MRAVIVGAAATAAVSCASFGQLRESEVLVVYDARISDSLLVAEAYAGSAKVPGGVGGVAGSRPGVRVVNLAALSGAGVFPAVPDVDYATFETRLRNPLRAYLAAQNLTYAVRCLVLTKGIPHRIQNINPEAPLIGDDPVQINGAFAGATFGNFTFCSVDSELALLWQNLSAGENIDVPANGDSFADGLIASPFAQKGLPGAAFSNRWIASAKPLTAVAVSAGGPAVNGFLWRGQAGTGAAAFSGGDMYLVCRLDGPTVNVVRGMISRARNLAYQQSAVAVVIDRDGQNFDASSGFGAPFDTGGADYTNAFNALNVDNRFPISTLFYDTFSGFTSFFVGPNTTYSGGPPLLVNPPIIYLASFGANHSGVTSPANTTYATSFNIAPGAVFNTMESYNGRDFGGRGQNPGVPQQQSSAFLGAGGTFAIGNVWEPFTVSVARNRELVNGFLLGNLSWGEAAYNALPALSWQQIVLGDPLCVPIRAREDINADGTVSLEDLYAWYAAPRDLNNSGVADDVDFRLLESSVRGFELVRMKGEQR